jgi:hypothetical protein
MNTAEMTPIDLEYYITFVAFVRIEFNFERISTMGRMANSIAYFKGIVRERKS